jgi:hypothetical protein
VGWYVAVQRTRYAAFEAVQGDGGADNAEATVVRGLQVIAGAKELLPVEVLQGGGVHGFRM